MMSIELYATMNANLVVTPVPGWVGQNSCGDIAWYPSVDKEW